MRNTINPKKLIVIIILIGIMVLLYSIFSNDKTENFVETYATFYNVQKKIFSSEKMNIQ